MQLKVLSGGAARALIGEVAADFAAASGCEIDASFASAGATRAKLLVGEPADAVILTQALIAALAQDGHVVAGSAADLGAVATSIATRAGDPAPAVADAASLAAALAAADALYFPDPKLATAGIHFAGVLDRLGLRESLAPRLRPFPNGALAMRALADAKERQPLGCTQATEIIETPGCALIAPLPGEFALATVYTVGVCAAARLPDQARQFVAMLTGPETRDLRRRLGFTFDG